MRVPMLSLRVRIFLFFALLMVSSIVVIASAIYMAHQSTADQLPRLLATYTGVAAVIIVLVLLLVWQLFDRHVATALQSLARQMQTALHADIRDGGLGLKDQNAFQYLGPVSEAADELIEAYQRLKTERVNSAASDNTHAVQALQLAAILRDLDVGVLVMNRQHEIVLYNHLVFASINRPVCLGLARNALMLFDGSTLLTHANRMFELSDQTQPEADNRISLKLAHESRCLSAKIGPVFGPEFGPEFGSECNDKAIVTGYLLLFKDLANSPVSPSPNHVDESCPNADSMRALTSRPEFYDFDLFDRPMPADLEGCQLRSLDYVVFDTETTGLNPSGGDQIISIAAVRIVNGRVLTGEYFDELIHPGMMVPDSSIAFHGITDQMLADKPGIDIILPHFAEFAGDSILVAHNAAFDMKFIEQQSERCQVQLDNPVLDTVLLSAFVHDHTNMHTLEDLADRFGIDIQGRHTALGDALATANVFIKLVEQLAGRGIFTVGEATSVSNKMTHIKRQQNAY